MLVQNFVYLPKANSMQQSISIAHKKMFEEIKKDLTSTGAKEGNFIKVELLFYQAISIAREYGDDENENRLLAALKQLQAEQYQKTKAFFKKSTQREKAIRQFINSTKAVLTIAIKNGFIQSVLNDGNAANHCVIQ